MYCSTKGYYLSLFSSNLQVQFFYFKTSHVIVYHIDDVTAGLTTLFQNISCYCLSDLFLVCSTGEIISKHLMLLFIQAERSSQSYFGWISKHLMLLFISDAITRPGTVLGFQNISCYCLSSGGVRD